MGTNDLIGKGIHKGHEPVLAEKHLSERGDKPTQRKRSAPALESISTFDITGHTHTHTHTHFSSTLVNRCMCSIPRTEHHNATPVCKFIHLFIRLFRALHLDTGGGSSGSQALVGETL